MSRAFIRIIAIHTLCILTLSGCGDGGSDDIAPPRFNVSERPGTVSLVVTDGLIDTVDRVFLPITAVRFRRVGGGFVDVEPPRPVAFDLLTTNTLDPRTVILDSEFLPLGEFEGMRLLFDETRLFVDVGGLRHPLTLVDNPFIQFNFFIEEGADLDLTIDLNLRRSLTNLGDNSFVLRPFPRIVRTGETGTVIGTVNRRFIESDGCANGLVHDRGNAVYVFVGRDAPFQDIRGDLGDPLTTARVSRDPFTGEHDFRVNVVPAGEHTIVFTCNSSLDVPDADDSLRLDFGDPFGVDVRAQGVSTLDID